jgi:ribosomal-protein-alanine N-acetyltransferase
VIELHGELVRIRPLRAEEVERVIRDSLPAWVAWGTDPAAARERIRERLERSGELTEHGLDLAIESEGVLVGDVQARADGLPAGGYELGIGLFEEPDRGRGLGSEAIALLTAHLFEDLGARRIQITTDVGNVGMRRVAERVGFLHEGDLRGFWPQADGDRDYAMYGMTRADYEARRTGQGSAPGSNQGSRQER